MNSVNIRKLLSSKWTAVNPVDRERHFIVSGLSRDAQGRVSSCELEAVINGRRYQYDWRSLKDSSRWLPGWK